MRSTGPDSGTGLDSKDRGVSDVLAFVLVFGIILSSVALLSTVGFQAMTDYQENEQQRNAERAMTALADNFNDVMRYSGIEQRYGELALREGTVTTGNDGTTANVTFGDDSVEEVNLGQFTYEADSAPDPMTIAYEGGGVVQGDGSGSVVLKRPQLKCNPETAIVSFVKVDADSQSIQSSEGLGVTMTQTEPTETVVHEGSDEEVTIGLETSYETAWESGPGYGEWSVTEDPSDSQNVKLTCANVDRLVVTVVTVDIDY